MVGACRPAASPPTEPSLGGLDLAAKRFPLEGDAPLRRARVLRDLGRLPEALGDYRAALALTPGAARAAQFGKELWDAGDKPGGRRIWEEGLVDFPENSLLLRNAAFARYDARDHAGAEQLYRRVLALAPDAPAGRTDLAWALLAQRRWEEARTECAEVLRRDPENAAARAILAQIPPPAAAPGRTR